MDALLARVTQQAVQYAIRSGISITAGFAVQQCHRLLQSAPHSKEREELACLQEQLMKKICIISPSIDMIELIAARGNTTLESTLGLIRDIRRETQDLGVRLEDAVDLDHERNRANKSYKSPLDRMKLINAQMKALLSKIEEAVPLINLAIATSGVNLSTRLAGTISPSRLLQASTFLTSADSLYVLHPGTRQQVGLTYLLSLYMLFAGHASRPRDDDKIRQTTWKEVIHKAQVKLWRVPLRQLYDLPDGKDNHEKADTHFLPSTREREFAYQLSIVEDLDDGRLHSSDDDGDSAGPLDDVLNAGIRDVIPVHEISKIFYADTGRLLNIGGDSDASSPVLLLRRDVHADPPRRMLHVPASHDGENKDCGRHPSENGLPPDLDPEWMAFEVYVDSDTPSSDDDDDDESLTKTRITTATDQGTPIKTTHMAASLSALDISSTTSTHSVLDVHRIDEMMSAETQSLPAIKTTLSLLEMVLKLTSLQQFRQESHLAIEDELLNFFLEDSSTAGMDRSQRHRLRHDAMARIGFDPYEGSPSRSEGRGDVKGLRDSNFVLPVIATT